MAYISVNPELCCKAISSHSGCDKCIAICPVQAISIDKKSIDIKSSCVECGLCASVCPTGALAVQEPTEAALYNKIVHIGKMYGSAIITCNKNTKKSKQVLRIPCIGSLSLEFLFAVNSLSFPVNVVYEREKCHQCDCFKGIDEYIKRLKKIEKLQKQFNLTGDAIKNVSSISEPRSKVFSKENNFDIERRKLLFSVFNGLSKLPQETFDSFMGKSKKSKEKSATKKRSLTNNRTAFLKRGLSKIQNLHEKSRIDLRLFPRLSNTCYFCKACTILCPMDALEFQKSDDSLVLHRDRCVGCRLCVDICYHNSLELEYGSIGEIVRGKSKILAKGIKQTCKSCGRDILASEVMDNCPICTK